MKIFLSFALSALFFFFGVQPVFASRPESWRPRWSQDINYIQANGCKVQASTSGGGYWEFYYSCPNGQTFWSDILMPVNNFPYLTTRPQPGED